MFPYVEEPFTAEEEAILRRYVTNLDQPVFALVNLPEVVKGALFARYSRSAKSLRRLFLDEFVGDLDVSGDATVDATVGLARAEQLYERVFFEYGDDSVAQLGGVHLACEQASNVLDQGPRAGPAHGLPRAVDPLHRLRRPPARAATTATTARPRSSTRRSGPATSATWTGCSTPTPSCCRRWSPWIGARHPRQPGDSDFVHRQAVRAKALDALRGLLPAASLSNVGIYGTGPVLRAAAAADAVATRCPRPASYAEMMLTELRKVIPSFLQRVDLARAGRGVVGLPGAAPATTRPGWSSGSGPTRGPGRRQGHDRARGHAWSTSTPRARTRSWRRRASPTTRPPTPRRCAGSGRSGPRTARALLAAYVGERRNRRHRPGRAFERTDYRFEVVSDYGAFRDLQRHRMLTVEWQPLSTVPRLRRPRAGRRGRRLAAAYTESMERSADLYDALGRRLPDPGPLRGGPGLPHPLRPADERPRGDARRSSCGPGPRAIRPTAGWPRQMHRAIDRGGRPPRHRRRHVPRRLRRRASSSGSTPSAGPRPAGPAGDGRRCVGRNLQLRDQG